MLEELEIHKTINIEPTWEGILPLLIAIVRDGNHEGYLEAKGELERMAKAADLWNEAQKCDVLVGLKEDEANG